MNEIGIPQQLKETYIQRRFQELELMKSSLGDPDFDYVKKVGHQIKGNADTFEFPALTGIGKRFEASGLHKNKEQLIAALSDYENQLTDYVKALRPTNAR